MGKKLKLEDPKTGEVEWVDEDNLTFITYEECVRRGDFGRREQYKYFSEHPNEIEDQKLFSKLEEEFGDNNNIFSRRDKFPETQKESEER